MTAARLGELLRPAGYHVLGEEATPATTPAPPAPTEQPTSYFPLLLILFYLLGAVAVTEVAAGGFDPMRAMGRFMAGFFLVFSFFKLLNLRAFADAYASYDVVAARWRGYGFVYPFIELGLGVAYLGNVAPLATNLVTLVVMGVSTVGVVRTLLARRQVRCACLGTVFNLPMSVVTVVEDVLMVGMAAGMLAWMM
ncbi:MAG: copper chaperone [Gemmataceae bacterium]|nr:copper chaperone [Gemmataceae bacterium]